MKELEGKVRVPSANDHPIDGNYPYNKGDSDDREKDEDLIAEI